MWDSARVRRSLLLMAFVLLVLIDLSIVPTAVLLIALGAIFSLVGHGLLFLPMAVFAVALGAGFVWLTVIVGKAAFGPAVEPPSRDAFGREQ